MLLEIHPDLLLYHAWVFEFPCCLVSGYLWRKTGGKFRNRHWLLQWRIICNIQSVDMFNASMSQKDRLRSENYTCIGKRVTHKYHQGTRCPSLGTLNPNDFPHRPKICYASPCLITPFIIWLSFLQVCTTLSSHKDKVTFRITSAKTCLRRQVWRLGCHDPVPNFIMSMASCIYH